MRGCNDAGSTFRYFEVSVRNEDLSSSSFVPAMVTAPNCAKKVLCAVQIKSYVWLKDVLEYTHYSFKVREVCSDAARSSADSSVLRNRTWKSEVDPTNIFGGGSYGNETYRDSMTLQWTADATSTCKEAGSTFLNWNVQKRRSDSDLIVWSSVLGCDRNDIRSTTLCNAKV